MRGSEHIDMERSRREYLRWIILLALYHARPYGASEGVILNACRDIPIMATLDMIRKELKSLEKRGLVVVKEGAEWYAEITALGEDIVEYREDPPKGIYRPPQW
ncbi:MAG: hypothetical protein P3W91_000795 [Fervidobacterium sp.]|nr:hypothetical protein [Fervidobacterium sp.]